MAFQAILRPRARSDIADAVAWLASTNLAAAARVRNALLDVVADLETDPLRHPMADEAAELGIDLRMVLYGRRRNTYRILFTVEGQTVNVLRVRHTARDRLNPDDV
jgi:plasmid stabilization system protein ParE